MCLSEEQKLDQFIRGIREDLNFVEALYYRLFETLLGLSTWGINYKIESPRIKEFIRDTFLDKIFEIESKTSKFLIDISLNESIGKNLSTQEMTTLLRKTVENIKGLDSDKPNQNMNALEDAIKRYREKFEEMMDYVRESMYKTNWLKMKNINIEDYAFQKRRKYVTAREELEKAITCFKSGHSEDVFSHLRSAVEFSIKNKFGFNDIQMKNFLEFPDTQELNLPSHYLLYFIYDEGSGRLHHGKTHAPLEYQTALEFVTRFIDQLDLINISKEKVEEFKQKCKFVK